MNIKYIILLFVGAITLFSCDKEEQIGPDLEGIGFEPTPTTELTSSTREVDFSVGNSTMFFSQEFEKSTNWKLTLEGLNSGATKVIESSSVKINESNSLWDGLADGTPYFQKEKVKVTLSYPSFLEYPVSIDTFEIIGIVANSIKSVLFTDFKKAPVYQFGGQVPTGGGWGSDWPTTVNSNTKYPLYDGNAYLFLEGAPWQANNPYVDITEMPANVGDTLKEKYLPLYSNPERVYMNLAVYNTGTKNTQFSLQLIEDKGNGVKATRTWLIRPTWTGWKNISIKCSALTSEDASAFDVTKVSQINLLLMSDQALDAATKETVSIAIDRLEFSFDSPLGTVNY